MEAYYNQQVQDSMPRFSGHYRQRGSGFGALAKGIGRVALPIAKKVLWPLAKRIGREFITQGTPELFEIAARTKTVKQGLKSAVKNTAKKQLGGGKRQKKQTKKKQRAISKNKLSQKSRSDFFSRVKNAK